MSYCGLDVNSLDFDKKTILQNACEDSRGDPSEAVAYLIKKGAKIKLQRQRGWTALMDAANTKDKIKTMKVLLAKGADPSLKNKEGETALDLAIKIKDKEKQQLLRKYKKQLSSDS